MSSLSMFARDNAVMPQVPEQVGTWIAAILAAALLVYHQHGRQVSQRDADTVGSGRILCSAARINRDTAWPRISCASSST
jgi:hypothetical protein